MPRVNFLYMLFHCNLCQSSFVEYVSQLCSCSNCASNSCLEIIHSGSSASSIVSEAYGDTASSVGPAEGKCDFGPFFRCTGALNKGF